MWKCPKCGREFKKTNQGHYCGKAPETVDEYTEQQIPEAKEHITNLRNIIKKCVPEVSEYISWSMPYYEKNGQKISFAACKTYISFYPGAEILEKFSSELTGFTIKKNALHLPYKKDLPEKMIKEILEQFFQKNNP